MKTRFIHVGYPKTASTTLQRNFFSKHKNILYLGDPFIDDDIADCIQVDITKKRESLYDPSKVKKYLILILMKQKKIVIMAR